MAGSASARRSRSSWRANTPDIAEPQACLHAEQNDHAERQQHAHRSQLRNSAQTAINCAGAEMLFDAQQPVVLCNTGPIATANRFLIWPAPVATARSAMVVSSVSPDRCEITVA